MDRGTKIVIGTIWTVIWVALGGYFQSKDSGFMHVVAWFFYLMAGSSFVYMLKKD